MEEDPKNQATEVDREGSATTPAITNSNNNVIESQKPAVIEEPMKKLSAMEWFVAMNWKNNPFTFSIMPELFVGYQEQAQRVLIALQERHKFVYLAGPTGSGKTTLLRWLTGKLSQEFDVLYLPKPPEKADMFVDLFNRKFPRSWYAFWQSDLKTLYEIPRFLDKKLSGRHLVVLFDEAHESNLDVLEWLRVLSDQSSNMSVVLSGLPVFETHLKDKLETFRKRIAAKIELVSLTREESAELIRRRIQSVGGTGNEFSSELVDFIYVQSGGFPREIIRVCDELVNEAIIAGRREFARPMVQQEVATRISLNIIDEMTHMQREIIEMLAKNPMSPGDIANAIDLSKYKSRQHAVRSVNNVMKKLYEDGYLERRRSDKAFIYSLSGKLRTIVVKA